MQLLESGLFGKAGFKRLHVAGHPEGNKDIDPDGSDKNVMDALRWKAKFAETSDAQMALATQFAFEAGPIIEWADSLQRRRYRYPDPHRHRRPCQTANADQIRHRLRRWPIPQSAAKARDGCDQAAAAIRAEQILTELAAHKAANPDFNITHVHFFPLGGIKTNANWAISHGGASAVPATQS